jgi:hypothetical protein
MSLTDDNANDGSASASAPTPYVFLIFACVIQFLGLAIDFDMLDMFCSYRSLVNMVSLISMFHWWKKGLQSRSATAFSPGFQTGTSKARLKALTL